MFDAQETARYSRHFRLPEFGRAGQERLKRSSAAVVGAGGLGSPSLLYLAAAGIGRIRVIEFDRVDRSNLQRQILFEDSDTGHLKLERAVARLRALNPTITIEPSPGRIEARNALEKLGGAQVVLDGSDNFPTRYLVNDACLKLAVPLVSASVLRFEGQIGVFGLNGSACYRCLFPEPPSGDAVPSCADAGVLGAVPGVLGSLQAIEAIKILAGGIGAPLTNAILVMDFLEMEFRKLRFSRRKDCTSCGVEPSQLVLRDMDDGSSCPPGPSLRPPSTENGEVTVEELRERLDRDPAGLWILDVREDDERQESHIPNSAHIPLGQVEARFSEIPRDREIVVYCAAGIRSARACALLAARGVHALNLVGGMHAWEE